MLRFMVLLLLPYGGLSATSLLADDLFVWSNRTPEARQEHSLRGVLLKECLAALDQRERAYEGIRTAEDLHVWNQQRREFFQTQLGRWPDSTPLNAQVVGIVQADGYRIEKILFESQPGHHVTGNLYLPATAGPHPAVLIPCGHSYNGKAAEGYQRVSILMARNGIAAFCYDPIGQGERYQAFAADGTPLSAEYQVNPNSLRQLENIPGQPRFNPVEEHTLIGIGSILVGRNTATYRIFDGMRCVDYLVSRPDILADRIGCTGNSGGGTLTAYLMALDERIYCAAPGCYMTTFRRLLETNGPQDAEQNIHGQIRFGMDEADYVLMRAPRPTVLLAGTRDATFDITGTWDILRESKRAYARLDLPERVDIVEADAPHGFTTQLRVGAVRWMSRWLLDRHEPIIEPDFPIHDPAELQCTPRGQVAFLPNERTVFDLNRELAAKMISGRHASQSEVARVTREQICQTAGMCAIDQLPEITARVLGESQWQGYRVEKLVYQAEGRGPLPTLRFHPAAPNGETTLLISGSGKSTELQPDGKIIPLLRQGHVVLALDLPGIGETADATGRNPARRYWADALFGPDGESFWLSYLLGRSLVGLRAEAILSLIQHLEAENAPGTARKLHVIATGSAGPPALHAVVFASEAVSSLTLHHSLASWQQLMAAPLGHAHLTETVHGVLAVYDLPDLVSLIGQDKVRIEAPLQPR